MWSPEGVHTELCMCRCHREGVSIMHAMACCNLCYDTYLTKDGEIIPEKLQAFQREGLLDTLKRQSTERYESAKALLDALESIDDISLAELEQYSKMSIEERKIWVKARELEDE